MDSYLSKSAVQALAAIGTIYIASKLFSYVRLLASLFLIPGVPLSKFGPKGSWAVITGASDGIGKEFALQLARKGYNIILISRTASKLESLASEITKAFPNSQTKTYTMDFAQNKDSDYQNLQRLISGLDISILVNNVGLSHSIPVPFLQTTSQEMKDIITINVTGTLRVTQMIAPGMVTRKRGLILTMASFGGVFPTPLLATYSGSKAFLQHWGTSLGAELAPSGVTVQVIQSHLVASAMSKIRRTSAMVPSPKQFVRAALGSIGRSGGSQDIAYTGTPWWSHGIMQWSITNLAPGGKMGSFVLGQNKVMHEDIRKRALRKAERDGKKGK